MRLHIVPIALAAIVVSSGGARAQALVCPPATTAGSQACEVFHYHVSMYRADTRLFADIDATDQFASQAACERVRDAVMKRNLAIVDYMKRVRGENQYEPDRIGPCHCDATIDRNSTNYRTDAQRLQQRRVAEEIRQRVRERLLDSGLTSDAELVRPLPPSASILGGPKLVPIPQSAPVTAMNAPADLRVPKLADTTPTTMAGADLALVDVNAAPAAPAVATVQPVQAPQPALQTVVVEAPPAPLPAPAPAPAPAETTATTTQTQTPAPAPAPAPVPASAPAPAQEPAPAPAAMTVDPATPAEDVAEAFIAYETQRIDKVLDASNAITDDNIKSKILDACSQRIQLLSNLRPLIQVSGMRSKLAGAVVGAQDETERMSLVAKLFGSDMPKHWAPKDATDVLLDAAPDLEADPEKALRDKTGRFTDQQKRRALYLLLSRSQPTEDQQLWLTTVIDGFLQGT
ncbi:MAG: hypothetical protein QOI24_3944 [Acidobacteriota bacterium]|jgi:hypothetical protein|nr:hypothetical protein [Acidobacteriota bacterium]